MKKKTIFLICILSVLLLSACGAKSTSTGSPSKDKQPQPVEQNETLLAQQAEYERACSLLEAGDYAEAERIFTELEVDLPEAGEKLLEVKQLRLLQEYAGTWVFEDLSGQEIVLASDGTGTLKDSTGSADFTFSATESGIQTSSEAIAELQLVTKDGVKALAAGEEESVFYCQADILALPGPEKVEITPENWEEYFEIITDVFAQNWDEDNNLAYHADILYFFPKAEIRDQISPFHPFEVTFTANYDRVMYYVGVDHETFMPLGKTGIPEKLGNSDGVCVLNLPTIRRIETGNIVYSDGFAHQSLRDGEFIRYSRFWDVAENIKVTSVEGCLFLTQNTTVENQNSAA